MILKYYIQIIVDWTLLSIRYKYLIQYMVSPIIDFLHKPLGLQQSIHHPELSLPTSSAFYQSLMYSLWICVHHQLEYGIVECHEYVWNTERSNCCSVIARLYDSGL